jgi:hypothetical protein
VRVLTRSPLCEHHDGAAFVVQLGNGAVQAGCHHNSCSWDWHALRAHCESAQPNATQAPSQTNSGGKGSVASTNAGGRPSAASLPKVRLPGGRVSVTDTADELGKLLGATGGHFRRGRSLTILRRDDNSVPTLELVRTAQFISVIEAVCQPVKPARNGDLWERTTLGRQTAEAILSADALADNLPPIKAITRCPILLERGGSLVQVTGYDRASGIYANDQEAPEMSLSEAKAILAAPLADFLFATPSDRSRALAAILTPAMVFGGLLPGRAPATVVEADESQTGKGFLVRIIAAIYGDTPATIADGKGGVGSIGEKFDAKVLEGRAFVSWDNIKFYSKTFGLIRLCFCSQDLRCDWRATWFRWR